MENSFLDELREELIDGDPDKKILFDYIDGRITEAVQQEFYDRAVATKEEVQEMILAFNDR